MYKIKFKIKSFDLDSIKQTENFLLSLFSFFDLDKPIYQQNPRKYKKITVLRSPHIDKKSREQFQILTHKKTLVQIIPNKNIVLLVFEILKDTSFKGVELDLSLEFSTF